MSEPNEIHQQDVSVGYDTSEPRNALVAILGVLIVASLIVIYFGIDYYYGYVKEKETYEKVLAPTSEILKNVHNRENWNLSTYQYVDAGQTAARIPIDRAIELTLKDYAEGKMVWPMKAAPVKAPEPAAPAPGTPGTAPVAAAAGAAPVVPAPVTTPPAH